MVASICLLFWKLRTLYPFSSPTAEIPRVFHSVSSDIYGIHGIKMGARARACDNISLIPAKDASSILAESQVRAAATTRSKTSRSVGTHDPSRIYLWDLTKDGQDLDCIPKGTSRIQEIQDRRSSDAEQSSLAYGSKLLSRRPFLSPRRFSPNLWSAAAFLIFVFWT